MPIDTDVTLSPGWWFKRLLQELGKRQQRYDLLDSYYRGDPPAPWGPENCSAAFRKFQLKARANWANLIVEAVRERQVPVGFRTGAEGDDFGDAEAWRIWQANNLDAEWKLHNRAKLSMSDAYMIVGPPATEGGVARITPEDPRQVVTAPMPGDRRMTRAALKVFRDDWTGDDLAYLYLPGVVVRARRRAQGDTGTWFDWSLSSSSWEWDGDAQELGVPVVPVVHFGNRSDLFGRSLGEFEDVIDDIDRIHLMLLQRLTVAVMQAFRQRAIKGSLPDNDHNGDPVDYNDLFRADPGAVWQLPDGVDLWESGGVDLTPLLESVKADVRDLAATTRTPMFYLFPDAANGSAEGASLQREGLIFKVRDRNDESSDPLERVMALAFMFQGDTDRASVSDMEVLWAPPERFSLTERASAATQAAAAGVPWGTIMSDFLQFSPQQVARMAAERAVDALLAPPTTTTG